jgi:hypothetical protein
VTADTPDPRPAYDPTKVCARYFGSDKTLCSTHNGRFLSDTSMRCERADRPVSPPSELTAATAPVIDDYLPDATLDMRRGWEAAIRATLDAARAAPQTDANLEGYWERAYWEIVPKLQAALDAAPQADPPGWCREHRRPGSECRDEVAYNCDIAAASLPATAGHGHDTGLWELGCIPCFHSLVQVALSGTVSAAQSATATRPGDPTDGPATSPATAGREE